MKPNFMNGEDQLEPLLQHDVLTREQEADLFKRIQLGRFAQQQLDSEAAYAEPEVLSQMVKEGNEAHHTVIEHNYKLVLKSAIAHGEFAFDTVEDAFSVAYFGLETAIKKFDHTKGYKFSTYATFWLFQHLQRGESRGYGSRPIRLPAQAIQLISQRKSVISDLTDISGDAPSEDEVISELAHINSKKPDVIRATLMAVRNTSWTTSLDRPALSQDGDSRTLGESIVDSTVVGTEDEALAVFNREIIQTVHEGLQELIEQTLTEREAVIVRAYYLGDEDMTDSAVGELFGLSGSRAGQLRREALAKLRSQPTARELMGYLTKNTT